MELEPATFPHDMRDVLTRTELRPRVFYLTADSFRHTTRKSEW